ncbi:MAG: hypothetical protein A2750_01395 [Candidatus Yanofskybacteria bacterium RIFCSPHIGHO2_01_FULL_45_42]|uniref:Acyl-CoA dehydrogenase n=1 Tax=Candidatus Yanofskybacteria bacterium RIFCSPHIGHO2_01_FULL_45_42 TaxID=1802671 RepID=A0A1F8F749_9BACT|nr:MAG: hypothetical protein A2750_01395 [Candidatus Yanofskybacteria bacterium RIFCSPHIGHO2_01_FULL_45_42]OGY63886.1 MAG: hypothetical protein A3J53_03635 [Candidatus Harrisonbacteria bacterium RIFCSPHIGHO2_02_FULL_40_20]
MKEDKDLLRSEEMAVVEEAREKQRHTGFISGLFLGNVKFDLLRPFPEQSKEDKEKADAFLEKLRLFLLHKVDPNAIDRDGEISDEVIRGLKDLGIFGLKIPEIYGGLGFSQSNYRRIFEMMGGWCANTVSLVAPPNSIGAAVPILKFGTEEQRKKYLPELARGKISSFALTEVGSGSDPSRIKTVARRVYNANGEHIGYSLNGEKLYTTGAIKENGIPLGDYIAVVARTKDDPKAGSKKGNLGFGLFLVDSKMAGFSTPYRCHFEGLRAIYNGVLKFDNVFVPKDNLIGNEGDGFKIAFQSLTIGRLTIASSCVGGLKQALQIARWWCKERNQWRRSIGEHEKTGAQLVRIACLTMVTDAFVRYCTKLVDDHKDVRIETAVTKVLSTEYLWEALCHLMQIRAGRGYETYYSLKQRGETAVGVGRMWRDAWVNRIFEGENKVMTLFVGREGTDEYLQRALVLTGDKAGFKNKAAAGFWVLKQLVKSLKRGRSGSHENFIKNEAKRLTYQLLRAGAKYQAGLQKKQLVIDQVVARALNLFLMAVSLAYAEARKDQPFAKELADYFCATIREEMAGQKWTTSWLLQGSHLKIEILAKRIMDGEAKWLEEGIISMLEKEGVKV